MSEIIADTRQRAAKTHYCDDCGQMIVIGEEYRRIRGKWDGDVGVYRCHLECYTAVNDLHKILGLCSDEGISLRSDLEPEDVVWLKQKYPMVADRLRLK